MGHWVEIEKKMSGFLVRIWFTSCLKVIETIYRGRALDNAFSICKTIVPPLGNFSKSVTIPLDNS